MNDNHDAADSAAAVANNDAAATTHLLYLHGFRSSPRSAKAVRMARFVAERHPTITWWCPQLPASPREALALVMAGIAGWPAGRTAVVGSSLGGFYAACVSARSGCRAALLNPAVAPARDLARQVGEQPAWHAPGASIDFRAEYLDELRLLEAEVAHADPARCLAVIATGDEVLDWREMAARHHSATLRIVDGGNHALTDFEPHLVPIAAFLRLA